MLKAIEQGKICQVYLVFGDRFLCRQVVDQLLEALIPDQQARSQNVRNIDGDQEDQLDTLNNLKSYSLFGGRQVFRVNDSRLFHSKSVAKSIWQKAKKAGEAKDVRLAGIYLKQLAEAGGLPVDELADLSAAKWKSIFSFARPQETMAWLDSALASIEQAGGGAAAAAGSDNADLYMHAIEAGIPDGNILILQADTVDKRKRFYKFLLKNGIVADLSVDTGSSKMARNDQEAVLKELIAKTLESFHKTIESRAIPALLERVGFHPVAVVRETEKLALYVGESPTISLQDLEAIVGRTREDALYELTEAFADRNLDKALLVSARLFESGVHPLVLVSGLRNMIKKLMLVRSFRESAPPVFVEGMTFAVFQKGYLPELKEVKDEWLNQLPTHPYALFMLFEKAKSHALSDLFAGLAGILQAEHLLKSSSLPAALIFENFLLQSMAKASGPQRTG